jgi:hypothetical protein
MAEREEYIPYGQRERQTFGGYDHKRLRQNIPDFLKADLEREFFDKKMGEETRRYDQGFGEDKRRYENTQDAFSASQARGDEAMGQYDQLFNTPLAELGQYEQSIIDQSTPGQENARQATIAALAKQGIRGPQAALETSRQAGMMGQDMQNQLAGTKFKEAMDRRAAKGKMKGEVSLQGLGGGL